MQKSSHASLTYFTESCKLLTYPDFYGLALQGHGTFQAVQPSALRIHLCIPIAARRPFKISLYRNNERLLILQDNVADDELPDAPHSRHLPLALF